MDNAAAKQLKKELIYKLLYEHLQRELPNSTIDHMEIRERRETNEIEYRLRLAAVYREPKESDA